MKILQECGIPIQCISTSGYDLKKIHETHLSQKQLRKKDTEEEFVKLFSSKTFEKNNFNFYPKAERLEINKSEKVEEAK